MIFHTVHIKWFILNNGKMIQYFPNISLDTLGEMFELLMMLDAKLVSLKCTFDISTILHSVSFESFQDVLAWTSSRG